VKYNEFMQSVRERGGLDDDQADKAVRATLNTLAQRLAGDEPYDLAAQLPEELKLTTIFTTEAGFGHDLSAQQFVETVAHREGCPAEPARRHVQAVMSTLRDAVTDGEWDDIESQLGSDYRELVGAPG
jgi:uncharacterized protein (DUF2267 family)